MRTIDGRLFLEVSELEKVGIAYDRVKKARSRNSQGWTIIDDPQDRRRVLVGYEDLKPTVKALVDAVHGQAVNDQRVSLWRKWVSVDVADLATLRAHVLPDGSSLSDDVVSNYAKACAFLRMLNKVTRADFISIGYANAPEFHRSVCEVIQAEKVPLPTAYTKLKEKVRHFAQDGASVVISKKYGNSNSRKIETAQSAWIVSQYSLPTKPDTAKVAAKYQEVAKLNGWPSLTETAIYQHLHRAEIMPLWYIGRHGVKPWKNGFAHTMSLRGPAFRDALWCSDGTKLNYFYQSDKGVVASLSVYLVMDVYSEMVLGWSISTSENFKAQFTAAKAALKLSGHRPLQWLYDNQGGHKMKAQQDFLSRASKLHFPAQPYNAKSKPVESLIGRLQKQVMRDRWFFTGQNITSKDINSRANMEFVLAHKDQLPNVDQVMAAVTADIAAWNALAHPKTGVARLEMYANSVNPQAQPIDFLDMVELFWHESTRRCTYTNQGLTIEIGSHRLMYEVYANNGQPNMEFLRKYTNARFAVKYDPEELASIRLYKEDDAGHLRFVASASIKKTYARAVVDLQPGERAEIDSNLALRRAQADLIKAELDELRNLSGVDPETLVRVGYLGTNNKDQLNRAENKLLGYQQGEEDINPIDAL